jgi:prepilin-type N-terminal cleavage/methylation domain-containing protein
MKKNGFTLAEILVTLGIVGVVSAITMPTLISNNTKAQIGPKLAKAVSSFEQANLALLNANSVDALSDARILNTSKDSYYINELAKYIKMSYSSSSNS